MSDKATLKRLRRYFNLHDKIENACIDLLARFSKAERAAIHDLFDDGLEKTWEAIEQLRRAS